METEAAPAPIFKKRGPRASQIRKRPATPPPADSDSDSGYTSTEDEGRRIKRRKKSAIISASSKNESSTTSIDLSTTRYEADRTAQLTNTNDATKASDWYDEKSLLGATRERPSKADDSRALTEHPHVGGNGTYKGQAAYTSFIQKNPDHQKPKTVGPVKASSNVRTITVMDFAPDVCKDYKQTGFCGFGDSCKFLHAREDYKQGWELDKDWEKVGGKGKINGQRRAERSTQITEDMDSEEEDAALENIPFACVICKESYKNPIVTKCGHYFCEACALKRYKKNPTCVVCGAGTGGVFNGAKQLNRLLEKKRERARKRREKAVADGEEVDEEEEEGGEEDS